jgi:hypothetical protein
VIDLTEMSADHRAYRHVIAVARELLFLGNTDRQAVYINVAAASEWPHEIITVWAGPNAGDIAPRITIAGENCVVRGVGRDEIELGRLRGGDRPAELGTDVALAAEWAGVAISHRRRGPPCERFEIWASIFAAAVDALGRSPELAGWTIRTIYHGGWGTYYVEFCGPRRADLRFAVSEQGHIAAPDHPTAVVDPLNDFNLRQAVMDGKSRRALADSLRAAIAPLLVESRRMPNDEAAQMPTESLAAVGDAILHPFQRPPITAVSEQDVDLLLLEEIHASAEFRGFLLHLAFGEDGPHNFVGAWRSVSDELGETDVLMVVETALLGRLAILIEDKIDAIFQIDQGIRYRTRGQVGVDAKWWADFRTCLCGPESRIATAKDDWQVCVSLETLISWFDMWGDPRSVFRAGVLRAAVSKMATGGFVPNVRATAFWRRYGELQAREFPDLTMRPLSRESSLHAPWPRFCVGLLPAGVLLEHKPAQGNVDLTLDKRSPSDLSSVVAQRLPAGAYIARSGVSAAIRIAVPKIDHLREFDEHSADVRAALQAARALRDGWPTLCEALGF